MTGLRYKLNYVLKHHEVRETHSWFVALTTTPSRSKLDQMSCYEVSMHAKPRNSVMTLLHLFHVNDILDVMGCIA